ncbi:MAG TPA: hypothetical protein VF240_09490 [Pyrinomonadaceae bacterium]
MAELIGNRVGAFVAACLMSVCPATAPTGLEVHARAELLDGTSWTVPTLIGATLYVRDRRTITAFQLK